LSTEKQTRALCNRVIRKSQSEAPFESLWAVRKDVRKGHRAERERRPKRLPLPIVVVALTVAAGPSSEPLNEIDLVRGPADGEGRAPEEGVREPAADPLWPPVEPVEVKDLGDEEQGDVQVQAVVDDEEVPKVDVERKLVRIARRAGAAVALRRERRRYVPRCIRPIRVGDGEGDGDPDPDLKGHSDRK
jgi:hypothetical protein